MLALLLALFTPGNQICRITFGPFNHSSGLAQNGDPYQCKDSNPISVVLEGPHRSVGKTFDPSVAKAKALKTPLLQSCTRRATRSLRGRKMQAASLAVTGKCQPSMVDRWPISDFETRDTYSIIFSALNLQRISLAVIADKLLAELKHCAMQKKAKQARFWCQVEVTVLEVEMADDCVSTSALRCFDSYFEFPQNPFHNLLRSQYRVWKMGSLSRRTNCDDQA